LISKYTMQLGRDLEIHQAATDFTKAINFSNILRNERKYKKHRDNMEKLILLELFSSFDFIQTMYLINRNVVDCHLIIENLRKYKNLKSLFLSSTHLTIFDLKVIIESLPSLKLILDVTPILYYHLVTPRSHKKHKKRRSSSVFQSTYQPDHQPDLHRIPSGGNSQLSSDSHSVKVTYSNVDNRSNGAVKRSLHRCSTNSTIINSNNNNNNNINNNSNNISSNNNINNNNNGHHGNKLLHDIYHRRRGEKNKMNYCFQQSNITIFDLHKEMKGFKKTRFSISLNESELSVTNPTELFHTFLIEILSNCSIYPFSLTNIKKLVKFYVQEEKVDLNETSQLFYGYTPLHFLVLFFNNTDTSDFFFQLADVFLLLGASLQANDQNNRSPLQFADEIQKPKFVYFFKSKLKL
jgi:hypothetical protein